MAAGWVLDGFPHTVAQAASLQARGIVPDKALLLDAPHALLLERAAGRRVDPLQGGRVFRVTEPGAILPTGDDGQASAAPCCQAYRLARSD